MSRPNPYCILRTGGLAGRGDDDQYESDEEVKKKPFAYKNEDVNVTVTKVKEKPVEVEVKYNRDSIQQGNTSRTWMNVNGFQVSKPEKNGESVYEFKLMTDMTDDSPLTTHKLWIIPVTRACDAEFCKRELFAWAKNNGMECVEDCNN